MHMSKCRSTQVARAVALAAVTGGTVAQPEVVLGYDRWPSGSIGIAMRVESWHP